MEVFKIYRRYFIFASGLLALYQSVPILSFFRARKTADKEIHFIVRILHDPAIPFAELQRKYEKSDAVKKLNHFLTTNGLLKTNYRQEPGVMESKYIFANEKVFDVWKKVIAANQLEMWPMKKTTEPIVGTNKFAIVRIVDLSGKS